MMNYTVLLSGFQRFGDNDDPDFGTEIPYGGPEANIAFRCMNVAQDQPAIMLIEHSAQRDFTMTINGREIQGGLPSTRFTTTRTVNNNDGPDRTVTTVGSRRIHRHLILDAGVLRNDNALRIFQPQGPTNLPLEEFLLGDIAVFFKFSTSPGRPGDFPLNPEIRQ